MAPIKTPSALRQWNICWQKKYNIFKKEMQSFVSQCGRFECESWHFDCILAACLLQKVRSNECKLYRLYAEVLNCDWMGFHSCDWCIFWTVFLCCPLLHSSPAVVFFGLSASRLQDKQLHFAFGHVIYPNQNLFYNINTTLSSPNTSTRLMGKILQNLSATPTKYVVYCSYPVLYLTKCSW